VGQCYDGAANMSGCKAGVAKQIKDLNSKALYTHCHGHRLNLALCDVSTKLSYLNECITLVKALYVFVEGSAQRHALFAFIRGEEGEINREIVLKNNLT
jgi:hypothetical protein